jgi:hypothetical protein
MKLVVALGVVCTSVLAFAGIGDDFKDASNRDGCEAIPYSSERSSWDVQVDRLSL